MATPGDRCSKKKSVAYVEFVKLTERALRLFSSKILSPSLRLFSKPTASSSFGTRSFDELTFTVRCCYVANLQARQPRALRYSSAQSTV